MLYPLNESGTRDRVRQCTAFGYDEGALVGWGQLRSTGRQGSAIADDLIEFCAAPEWQDNLLRYAKEYAVQVESDYKKFCANVAA